MQSSNQPRGNNNVNSLGAKIAIGICIAVLLVIVAVVAVVVASGGSDDDVAASFPDEVRTGENYVGIYTLTSMPQEAFDAFISAADRWSGVVGGTSFQSFDFDSICDVAQFGSVKTFNHLTIGASVEDIDGVNGILGAAGPCLFFDEGPSAMGIMIFDRADINALIAEGSIESVILHEMGHVLGIGTLWSNLEILTDSTEENGISINNQPKFTGALGTAEFQSVTGASTSFIPVENGFTNGFRNNAGSGSVDGHWDEDFMPGELMVFQLSSVTPPLSSITMVSLRDLGYTVDTSSADPFSATNNLRASEEPKWIRYMVNDTLRLKPKAVTPIGF